MLLYKYVRKDVLQKILESGRLSIKSVDQFNDPFEGRWQHSIKMELPEHENAEVGQLDKLIIESNDMRSEYKITCFSATPLNGLMWSHYADCHTGACLEFKIEKKTGNYRLRTTIIVWPKRILHPPF